MSNPTRMERMRADPSNALSLWLHYHDVDAADIRVSARARDRFAARVIPTAHADDYLESIRTAAQTTTAVEIRRDGMIVYNPRALFDELDLTTDALSECTHATCARGADRYVIFPSAGIVRDYCSTHAARAESMTSA